MVVEEGGGGGIRIAEIIADFFREVYRFVWVWVVVVLLKEILPLRIMYRLILFPKEKKGEKGEGFGFEERKGRSARFVVVLGKPGPFQSTRGGDGRECYPYATECPISGL